MLSISVATTGIVLPIALSFSFLGLAEASPLQAFAAGAALCSTSLGTTFTVLRTSGLIDSRLGTVLSSAAMLDDVVGLVMVQVISNLNIDTSGFNAIVVVRPIAVSIGLVLVIIVVARFLVFPVLSYLLRKVTTAPEALFSRFVRCRESELALQLGILLVLITAASFAGTSNLFAAYLAGASISWWYERMAPKSASPPPSGIASAEIMPTSRSRLDLPESSEPEGLLAETVSNEPTAVSPTSTPIAEDSLGNESSATAIYHHYLSAPVQTLLTPFFFVSYYHPGIPNFGGILARYSLLMTVI